MESQDEGFACAIGFAESIGRDIEDTDIHDE